MKRNIILLIIILLAFNLTANNLISGEPLVCSTEDEIGPLPIPGVNTTVLGIVSNEYGKLPIMFMKADNWYPGIYKYTCLGYKNDVPYFSEPEKVKMPESLGYTLSGDIIEYNNKIYGYWLKGNIITETIFQHESNEFKINRSLKIDSLPRNASAIGVWRDGNTLNCLLEINDGKSYGGPIHWTNEDFPPYNSKGIFVGNLIYCGLYGLSVDIAEWPLNIVAKQETDFKQVMWGYQKISQINYPENYQGIITGSQNGNLLFYPLSSESDRLIDDRKFIIDDTGIMIRHNTIWARPVPFAEKSGSHKGLIVSGEGGIYYYPFKSIREDGVPVYNQSVPLLGHKPYLYGGSLIVPNLVDWDGDGDLDLIVGNSVGYIMFYENKGNNENPKFQPGVNLYAGTQKIHIQPGYKDDIQGPGESRWGYSCPNVVDWNGDGLLDIVCNDSRGKHRIFLNIGSKQKPILAPESPIYLDGLELHGTWRTRPGVARMGERMAYITQDADDEFHLYWQIDTYNLEDGGKLRLNDGKTIIGNHFSKGGGTGRTKFLIVDWDNDGRMDLIVGTPRHGSVPNLESGLPFNAGNKGAAVLFMRNVGTNDSPVYDYPKMISFKGKTLHFGQHSCTPTVGSLGNDNGLDLVVGDQMGRFYFFEREDLTW